jgi:hypothetical protein
MEQAVLNSNAAALVYQTHHSSIPEIEFSPRFSRNCEATNWRVPRPRRPAALSPGWSPML